MESSRQKEQKAINFNYELFKELLSVPFSTEKRKSISKKIKEAVFERDKHTCQLCHSLLTKRIKIPHHKNPRGESVEENLITLCLFCHRYVHYLLTKKGYKFHYGWG